MTSATSLPATFGPQWLDARLASLLPGYPDVPMCVALSGGVDSVTLIAALAELARGKQVRAIHVHHGLHADADRWTEHCVSLARRLRVPLDVVRLKLTPGRGESVEAVAREARYAVLEQALRPGEVLLTAHHQDDQLETVLLQLLRGAGVAGLAAMPEVMPFALGQLVRPLLSRSRAELEAWARARKLAWVDDDSNSNERFDRNYLRNSVLPLIRTRWPGAATAVARTARHAAEAQHLLDTLARADVESAAIGNQLSVQRLRALDLERRRNALRYWITRQGHRVPDSSRLDEIAGPLLNARVDSRPSVRWNDSIVKREGDSLWLGSESAKRAPAEEVAWQWQDARRLELSAFGGVLELVSDPYGPLDLETLPPMLTIRPRRGGEQLRPGRAARTRTLKALLQEARIPQDERATLPLIFDNDRLIAVADRWIDASVQASDTSMTRARFVWRTS